MWAKITFLSLRFSSLKEYVELQVMILSCDENSEDTSNYIHKLTRKTGTPSK